MDRKEWIKDLRAGSDVVVYSWGWNDSYREAKVERITPTGMIRVSGVLYRADGSCRSGGSELLNPADSDTQDRLSEYRRRLRIRDTVRRMHDVPDLDEARSEAIRKIMGWR